MSAVTASAFGRLAVVPFEQSLTVDAGFVLADDVGLQTVRLHRLCV